MDKAIADDSSLRQAIADYPTARLISESMIEKEVRDIISQNETKDPKKDAQRGKYGPWIITITLISALAVSYYQWNRHTSQTKIYAEVMKTYSPPINKGTRGSGPTSDAMNQAIREFDLRNIDASYDLFKGIKPKSDSVYWYLSHIALINGDVYEAKHYSKRISHEALSADVLQYVDRICLLYTSPSPRDKRQSRMPSSA